MMLLVPTSLFFKNLETCPVAQEVVALAEGHARGAMLELPALGRRFQALCPLCPLCVAQWNAKGGSVRGLGAMLSSHLCMQAMLQPTSCRVSATDAQADLIIRRAQHAQVSLMLPGRSSVCERAYCLFCFD